jgi:hypothetical protein
MFLGVGRWMRFPSRAHQSEHSTACCMRSPALPENKAPLLLPSFAFSGKSLSSHFRFLSPFGPSPCLCYYSRALGRLSRLRPLFHTLACSRPHTGQGGLRVPQFQLRKLRVPRSMPALRRVDPRQHVHAMPKRHTPHQPFWARCISHFHRLRVPTPHTQVSLVSRRHRTGRSAASWLAVAERLSAGESPQRVPLVDTCCVVLVPLSRDGSSWSNLSSC